MNLFIMAILTVLTFNWIFYPGAVLILKLIFLVFPFSNDGFIISLMVVGYFMFDLMGTCYNKVSDYLREKWDVL